MVAPAIVILGPSARPLADRLATALGGEVVESAAPADEMRRLFSTGRPIIGLCATAIVVRILAPALTGKQADPPVIAVAEDGSAVVPVLGGHHGANTLARKIAALTGGTPAITTASDVRFDVALDDPPHGYVLANPHHIKPFVARLLAGEAVTLTGDAPWLTGSALPFADDGALAVTITTAPLAGTESHLVYHPQTMCIGVGCARGAPPGELAKLVANSLKDAGVSPLAAALIASLDLKSDEAAITTLAARYHVPARFFDAATLKREAPRLANPSDVVMAEVGCPGVAEGACLAAAGPAGRLIAEKTKSAMATCAIALAPGPLTALPGTPRGRISITGIGPGSKDWRSPEATSALQSATDWVGYGLYLDLADDLAYGKTRHAFLLGDETERVRHAFRLAGQGRHVALVCSGDAAIYAMAALVYEVLDTHDLTGPETRVAIDTIPGISAFQAASARAGALIGHDFCTISLSDLLTPWPAIEARIRAAAEGDFNIAFYNPRSKKRTGHLARALAILKTRRNDDTPVIIASNLGRPGEKVRCVRLAGFDPDEVDMLTIVMIGSSQSRRVTRGDGRIYCYTPRGYAAKKAKAS